MAGASPRTTIDSTSFFPILNPPFLGIQRPSVTCRREQSGAVGCTAK